MRERIRSVIARAHAFRLVGGDFDRFPNTRHAAISRNSGRSDGSSAQSGRLPCDCLLAASANGAETAERDAQVLVAKNLRTGRHGQRWVSPAFVLGGSQEALDAFSRGASHRRGAAGRARCGARRFWQQTGMKTAPAMTPPAGGQTASAEERALIAPLQ